jgi:chromosomal replication initiation ATPase DnaA
LNTKDSFNQKYAAHVIQVLSAVTDAIRKVGADALINQVIRLSENSGDPIKKELEAKILIYTAEEFQITVDNLMNSNKRGDTVLAKKICFILFKEQLRLSEYAIAKYFARTPPIINNAVKEFKANEGKLKEEKRIINAYSNILEKINNFKEESNYEENNIKIKS